MYRGYFFSDIAAVRKIEYNTSDETGKYAARKTDELYF